MLWLVGGIYVAPQAVLASALSFEIGRTENTHCQRVTFCWFLVGSLDAQIGTRTEKREYG